MLLKYRFKLWRLPDKGNSSGRLRGSPVVYILRFLLLQGYTIRPCSKNCLSHQIAFDKEPQLLGSLLPNRADAKPESYFHGYCLKWEPSLFSTSHYPLQKQLNGGQCQSHQENSPFLSRKKALIWHFDLSNSHTLVQWNGIGSLSFSETLERVCRNTKKFPSLLFIWKSPTVFINSFENDFLPFFKKERTDTIPFMNDLGRDKKMIHSQMGNLSSPWNIFYVALK